jgi:hypothetical protein
MRAGGVVAYYFHLFLKILKKTLKFPKTLPLTDS